MKYRWDTKKLLSLYANKKTRHELEDLFISRLDFLGLFELRNQSLYDVLFQDLDYLSENEFCRNIVIYFTDYAFPKLDSSPLKSKISKDNVISLTYDFYKTMDSEIFTLFSKLFKERFTNFAFRPSFFEDYNGHTYYSASQKEIFIDVVRKKNILDVGCAIHEYGHGIGLLLNDFKPENDTKILFSEIEAVFFELLSFDFLESISDFKNDAVNARMDFVSSMLEDALTLRDKNEIIEIMPKYSDFKSLIKALEDELKLSKKDVKFIFSKPACDVLIYFIANIIAFELYHIYQTDPQKALLLYKKIVSLTSDEPREHLEKIKDMGIIPCQNIDTFVRKRTL